MTKYLEPKGKPNCQGPSWLLEKDMSAQIEAQT